MSAAIGDEHKRLDRGLPFRHRGFFFWKLAYVGGRVVEGAKCSAAGQRDRLVEFARPTLVANGASPPCGRPS
jgi:hypothetical protein